MARGNARRQGARVAIWAWAGAGLLGPAAVADASCPSSLYLHGDGPTNPRAGEAFYGLYHRQEDFLGRPSWRHGNRSLWISFSSCGTWLLRRAVPQAGDCGNLAYAAQAAECPSDVLAGNWGSDHAWDGGIIVADTERCNNPPNPWNPLSQGNHLLVLPSPQNGWYTREEPSISRFAAVLQANMAAILGDFLANRAAIRAQTLRMSKREKQRRQDLREHGILLLWTPLDHGQRHTYDSLVAGWRSEHCALMPTLCRVLRPHLPSTKRPLAFAPGEHLGLYLLEKGGRLPFHNDPERVSIQTCISGCREAYVDLLGQRRYFGRPGRMLIYDNACTHHVGSGDSEDRWIINLVVVHPLYEASFDSLEPRPELLHHPDRDRDVPVPRDAGEPGGEEHVRALVELAGGRPAADDRAKEAEPEPPDEGPSAAEAAEPCRAGPEGPGAPFLDLGELPELQAAAQVLLGRSAEILRELRAAPRALCPEPGAALAIWRPSAGADAGWDSAACGALPSLCEAAGTLLPSSHLPLPGPDAELLQLEHVPADGAAADRAEVEGVALDICLGRGCTSAWVHVGGLRRAFGGLGVGCAWSRARSVAAASVHLPGGPYQLEQAQEECLRRPGCAAVECLPASAGGSSSSGGAGGECQLLASRRPLVKDSSATAPAAVTWTYRCSAVAYHRRCRARRGGGGPTAEAWLVRLALRPAAGEASQHGGGFVARVRGPRLPWPLPEERDGLREMRSLHGMLEHHLATVVLPSVPSGWRSEFPGPLGGVISSHTAETEWKPTWLFRTVRRLRPQTICEVGFNAGHSAAAMLAAAPGARYFGFDLDFHGAGANLKQFELLRTLLRGRNHLHMTWGESPAAPAQFFAAARGGVFCDVAFLDARHDDIHVLAEARLFGRFAEYLIVDDLDFPEAARAWMQLVESGEIVDPRCETGGTRNEHFFGHGPQGDLQVICAGRVGGALREARGAAE